jgi:uroporphyrinogen-III decarboxylase
MATKTTDNKTKTVVLDAQVDAGDTADALPSHPGWVGIYSAVGRLRFSFPYWQVNHIAAKSDEPGAPLMVVLGEKGPWYETSASAEALFKAIEYAREAGQAATIVFEAKKRTARAVAKGK